MAMKHVQIDTLMNEVQDLQTGHDLLQELYSELSPYPGKKISETLSRKLNIYFGFEYSE